MQQKTHKIYYLPIELQKNPKMFKAQQLHAVVLKHSKVNDFNIRTDRISMASTHSGRSLSAWNDATDIKVQKPAFQLDFQFALIPRVSSVISERVSKAKTHFFQTKYI